MDILYLDYIDPFIIDIFYLFFTLIWIFSFVYWTARFYKIFLQSVLEIKKKDKTSKYYETL